MATKREADPPRKSYEKPRIIHSEVLQARAVTCARNDDTTCAAGPLFT